MNRTASKKREDALEGLRLTKAQRKALKGIIRDLGLELKGRD